MVAVLIFIGFVIIFILIFIFSGGKGSPENGVLYTKDGLYRKKVGKGYVSPVESALLGERESMQAIDISKIPVESFGRRRGAFGKWGYCVSNPICINDMDKNLQRYISHLFYENCRVESYDTEEVYSVSLFDKPVYKIALLLKGCHKVVSLYFIDSTYENHEIFPDGFSDYAVYLKKQRTEEERKKVVAERKENDVRFSLKTNQYDAFHQSSSLPDLIVKRGEERISLRDNEHRYDKQFSLELYEKMKDGTAEIKSIWKK